ncbi:MAG TPA: M20 family metallopeptidase [Phototrophicaceae bacterium]|nr:M20 family metallopeptidase [Phototrophicaceae bacterium]
MALDPVAFLEARQTQYLADLTTLAGMDSSSFDREDVNHVVEWLDLRLRALNFETERFPQAKAGDELLANRYGSGKGRVLLLGHSDTVFPRGTAAARPITYQGDKLLGPGTCDMKAGLLAGVYAAEALDSLGFHDYERLSLLIVSDEEIDERPSIPLIRSTCREFDAVLTLEAARENGDIVTARKGVRSFEAQAFGHAAHSGVEPEKGRNAILALAKKIVDLQALNRLENGISVNVGYVEGGRLRNIVPDHASIRFEARAFNQPDLDEITRRILNLFAQEDAGVRFEVSYEQASPPMPHTPAVTALEALAVQTAADLGFTVRGAKTGGAADAAYAVDEGVPALDGLGPVGGLDHGPDEYILVSSIVPRIALLARLIMAICKTQN